MAVAAQSENALLPRAQGGDQDAFAELIGRFEYRLAGFLRRILGPGADVEDALQVVFTRAYFSLPSFRSEVPVEAWLYRIARNHAIDRLRRRKARPERALSALSEAERTWVEERATADPGANPAEASERAQAAREAWALLGRLTPKDRSILLLKELEGKTLEEIAQITGLRVGAIKVRIFRARKRLRKAAAALESGRQCKEER